MPAMALVPCTMIVPPRGLPGRVVAHDVRAVAASKCDGHPQLVAVGDRDRRARQVQHDDAAPAS